MVPQRRIHRMSVEVLQIVTLILFVLSGAFFIIAVCLFFAFDVPGIIGNLSGITAKKAIEDIKARNEDGNRERVSYSRLMKDKRTEKIAGSSRLNRQTGGFKYGKTTKKSSKNGKTASLGKKLGETVRLDAVDAMPTRETTILSTNREEVNLTQLLGAVPKYTVDVDIVLCESTEEIV